MSSGLWGLFIESHGIVLSRKTRLKVCKLLLGINSQCILFHGYKQPRIPPEISRNEFIKGFSKNEM